MITKTCSRCKKVKGYNQFRPYPYGADGHFDYCKECVSRRQKHLSRNKERGWIYLITNPAWPGFVKVGRAVNIGKRLQSYQTSSPHRDYVIRYSREFRDVGRIERVVGNFFQSEHEWYKVDVQKIVDLLETLK